MAKFLIERRLRGFICTTAHPVGCSRNVEEQVAKALKNKFTGPRSVLVIGASTGYGLASRIAAAFGAGADTLGVFFERPADGDRTASAGWYNTVAFEELARRSGLLAASVNGDAFSDDIKEKTIELIGKKFKKIDLVIYSLAAPRRTDRSGVTHKSVLKPIGKPFVGKTVNLDHGTVTEVTIDPATDEEIAGTVAVMGGEDWELWMGALASAGVLAKGAKTVAYGYIGPELTWPIYRDGTIGRAKAHLESTVDKINAILRPMGGEAHIAINKAVVTQASAAIPVVPLYISILFRLMKSMGTHETCIDQMLRLFRDRIYGKNLQPGAIDGCGRFRVDDLEMDRNLQSEIAKLWPLVTSENIRRLTDFDGYQSDFLNLFGFDVHGVDYNEAVETDLPLKELP
ncbi:MAG: trans-2-enoyl-CoA reductase family protein [Puniceicoccales bacterium]|jgi:enoyl-[acyl-carrier protein] reductase/trans-2-enoyl-CoA reductase (NAD+)|nr:trans-2-enoyl-CoA reductase family protein [Puniceicoccales bacterium]